MALRPGVSRNDEHAPQDRRSFVHAETRRRGDGVDAAKRPPDHIRQRKRSGSPDRRAGCTPSAPPRLRVNPLFSITPSSRRRPGPRVTSANPHGPALRRQPERRARATRQKKFGSRGGAEARRKCGRREATARSRPAAQKVRVSRPKRRMHPLRASAPPRLRANPIFFYRRRPRKNPVSNAPASRSPIPA